MTKNADEVYCSSCGELIKAKAELCPKCGVRQKTSLSTTVQPMKNPGIAAIASFFFSGLGQIYNGEIGKGIVLIIIQFINILLMFIFIGLLTYPLVWLYGIYDAYKTAEKFNANMVR
jgi:TM2 domain-containing membrane protein YozV